MFAWIAHTRRDVLFEVPQLAQVMKLIFGTNPKEEFKSVNLALKYLVKYFHENLVYIVFPKHDLTSLWIFGFSDDSFANSWDHSTQLEFTISVLDESSSPVLIHFGSFKARRVVRSVLSGELTAFGDMTGCATFLQMSLDASFWIKNTSLPFHGP